MKVQIESLIFFTSKALIIAILIYLIIYSLFGNIFSSLQKAETLINKINILTDKIEKNISDDLGDIRLIIDSNINNKETLFLLAKKYYEIQNYKKSLYYLSLLNGLNDNDKFDKNKVYDLNKLLENKIN